MGPQLALYLAQIAQPFARGALGIGSRVPVREVVAYPHLQMKAQLFVIQPHAYSPCSARAGSTRLA